MKRILLAFIFVLLVSSVTVAYDLTTFGCKQEGGYWFCPKASFAENVSLIMADNIGCYSTIENASCTTDCSDIIDIGCVGVAEIKKDVTFSSCESRIGETKIDYGFCENISLNKGDGVLLAFDPAKINYAACNKYMIGSVYTIECPYKDLEIVADLAFFGEPDVAIVVNYTSAPSLSGFFIQNIIYIILVVILIIIFLWVFLPKKKLGRKIHRKTLRKKRRSV